MQTDLEKAEGEEATKLESSVEANVSKVNETNVLFECLVIQVETEEVCPILKEFLCHDPNAEINGPTIMLQQISLLLNSHKEINDKQLLYFIQNQKHHAR